MLPIELVEIINENESKLLKSQIIDGSFKCLLYENMLKRMKKGAVDNIFSNGYKALKYFAEPLDNEQNLSKILCLGKVQSGKTAFFITTIALAFDNGYDIVYLIGGTKNTLRDQNLRRVKREFSNNEKVKVFDLNQIDEEIVSEEITKGFKLIIVVLKNTAEKSNLGLLDRISINNSTIPTLIIDDEGDEYTPGAPKSKRRNIFSGKTHDLIVDIINNINCCTFMSVTATPQANLLLSTVDEISPDYIVLVEPGKDYTGGNAYHDTIDNTHVVMINDSDDFTYSIPDSFEDCFYFFIFACCLQQARNKKHNYSMLVHPSSLKRIHKMIREKIFDYFIDVKRMLLSKDEIAHRSYIENLKFQYDKYLNDYPELSISFDEIIKYLPVVLDNIEAIEFNSDSIKEESNSLYKIYVGGNMLGRGLTIENLIVTYIYRDAKESAIDTLYQRARWFGYKADYFDICKVYMTKNLMEKFIATVESENDLWNAVRSFLLTNINVKRLPRIFKLNHEKLILTRKTISKTITFERTNPGYSYDRSIYLTNEEKESNRKLYEEFYEKYSSEGYEKQFGNSNRQIHFIIEMKYSIFYNDFLKKYVFPKGSDFGHKGFYNIYSSIIQGVQEDKVTIVIMRYKTMQFRALEGRYKIKELPQSWDEGTKYKGDKYLDGLQDRFHFQIHLVYFDKVNKNEYLPMLALNNPLTQYSFRYVTGDNYYETSY